MSVNSTSSSVTGTSGAPLALDGADITTPTAMPAGGSGIRGWLSAIWTKLNGSLAVTGTFWQATQPISAAALPLPTGAAQDGADITTPTAMPAGGVGIRGWLSAIWTKLNGSLAVTGTFFQATQPVSGTVSVGNFPATQNTDVTDRAARLLGVVVQGTAAAVASAWPVKITDGTNVAAVKAASTAAVAADPAQVVAMHPLSPAYFKASDVVGTVLSVANTAATLTVAAGGAGLFLYITRIRVTMHNTSAAAVAGSAAVLAFTSTNIPGSLAWTAGNALAAGTDKTVVDEYLDSPIKTSVAATATTIVAPACGAGVQARITLYGYYGA